MSNICFIFISQQNDSDYIELNFPDIERLFHLETSTIKKICFLNLFQTLKD